MEPPNTSSPLTGQDREIADAVARERPRLRNFIRRRVVDQDEAEDILQDVFEELVEAWRLFCKELQLDPDELLDVGLATIRLAEETSRQTAFSADEALAYVCEHCPTLEGIARLTAQDEAHGLRRLFEAELAKWGAPSTANAGPRPG